MPASCLVPLQAQRPRPSWPARPWRARGEPAPRVNFAYRGRWARKPHGLTLPASGFLRPELQSPERKEAQQQALLPEYEEAIAVTPTGRRHWPKALPEQVRAVRSALAGKIGEGYDFSRTGNTGPDAAGGGRCRERLCGGRLVLESRSLSTRLSLPMQAVPTQMEERVLSRKVLAARRPRPNVALHAHSQVSFMVRVGCVWAVAKPLFLSENVALFYFLAPGFISP